MKKNTMLFLSFLFSIRSIWKVIILFEGGFA